MAFTSKNLGLYKSKNQNLTASWKTQRVIEDSKRKRELMHSRFRNIQESPEVEETKEEPKVGDERKNFLLKWREDKRRRLEQEKMNKKPVFKTGVVKHSIGSPYFRVFNDSKKTLKGVTSHKFKFRYPSNKAAPKLTIPVPPKFSERKTICKTTLEVENRRILRSNVIKENVPALKPETKTLRNKIVDVSKVKNLKAETDKILKSKVKTPSPKTILTDISNVSDKTPAKNIIFSPFSPNVCLTRGKRRPFVRSSEDLDEEGLKEKKEKKIRSQLASAHFKKLEEETRQLHSCCDMWNSLLKTNELPEEISNEIDALTGKTRLLTSDKFMQFRRLVEQFESGNANPPIHPDDLTGFWEMVYLQVMDLEQSFQKLDSLKSTGWRKVKEQRVTSQPKKVASKSAKPKKATATSSLRNFIAAARQNKNQPTLPSVELKTFDTGSFQIVSPVVQSSANRRKSSVNNSLLRQAVTSESKLNSSALAAMNAVRKSTIGRSIISSPIVIMNQNDVTPRSILRKSVAIAFSPLSANVCKKSLRFGHLEYQDAVTPNSDSSFEHTKVSKQPKKIKGTPYKRVSLNETFSMDEDESPCLQLKENRETMAPSPKSIVEAVVTPMRRSSRLNKEIAPCLEINTLITTPCRRSARLSTK